MLHFCPQAQTEGFSCSTRHQSTIKLPDEHDEIGWDAVGFCCGCILLFRGKLKRAPTPTSPSTQGRGSGVILRMLCLDLFCSPSLSLFLSLALSLSPSLAPPSFALPVFIHPCIPPSLSSTYAYTPHHPPHPLTPFPQTELTCLGPTAETHSCQLKCFCPAIYS